MARLARAVIPGVAHHLTQRCNHRQDVFFRDEDRRMYIATLAENTARYGVRLIGYCLMTNHVHLIAVPSREDSLAKELGRTHADYARWLHIRQRQTGHLWQNRFFSCPLDPGHCWTALRYVERNPLRAGLAGHPSDWPWSSALAHLGGCDAAGLLDMREWSTYWSPASWKRALEGGVGDAMLEERIRLATKSGRPLGTGEFVKALERELGRPLAPQKRGRKERAEKAAGGAGRN